MDDRIGISGIVMAENTEQNAPGLELFPEEGGNYGTAGNAVPVPFWYDDVRPGSWTLGTLRTEPDGEPHIRRDIILAREVVCGETVIRLLRQQLAADYTVLSQTETEISWTEESILQARRSIHWNRNGSAAEKALPVDGSMMRCIFGRDPDGSEWLLSAEAAVMRPVWSRRRTCPEPDGGPAVWTVWELIAYGDAEDTRFGSIGTDHLLRGVR